MERPTEPGEVPLHLDPDFPLWRALIGGALSKTPLEKAWDSRSKGEAVRRNRIALAGRLRAALKS